MTTRVLKSTVNTAFVTFYVGETAVDADVNVAVTVKDAAGVTLSSGNATNEPGVGIYSYAIPSVAVPTILTVTWTGTFTGNAQTVTQRYEVVETHLFSTSDLRQMDGLESLVTFPTQQLVDTRDEVTDLFNAYCHTAWGETYAEEIVGGDGTSTMILSKLPARSIVSVTAYGVPLVTTGWTIGLDGELAVLSTSSYKFTSGRQNYVVRYTYGMPYVPGDLRRAALRTARHWLLMGESSIPDRARMMTTQWGSFQLTTATEDFPTGIPEVDAVLNRYNRRLPEFA